MPQKDSQMNLEVKVTNMDLTPSISDYLTEKLLDIEKLINVKSDTLVLAEVELGKTTGHHQSGDNLFKAEINLTVGGEMHRVVAKRSDIYEAIDEMKDEISKKLRRGKDKRETLLRKGGRRAKEMMQSLWNL